MERKWSIDYVFISVNTSHLLEFFLVRNLSEISVIFVEMFLSWMEATSQSKPVGAVNNYNYKGWQYRILKGIHAHIIIYCCQLESESDRISDSVMLTVKFIMPESVNHHIRRKAISAKVSRTVDDAFPLTAPTIFGLNTNLLHIMPAIVFD